MKSLQLRLYLGHKSRYLSEITVNQRSTYAWNIPRSRVAERDYPTKIPRSVENKITVTSRVWALPCLVRAMITRTCFRTQPHTEQLPASQRSRAGPHQLNARCVDAKPGWLPVAAPFRPEVHRLAQPWRSRTATLGVIHSCRICPEDRTQIAPILPREGH